MGHEKSRTREALVGNVNQLFTRVKSFWGLQRDAKLHGEVESNATSTSNSSMKTTSSTDGDEFCIPEKDSLDEAFSNLLFGQYSLTKLDDFLNQDISTSNELVPRHHYAFSPIEHLHQLDSWDCGIACLLMIIRWIQSADNKQWTRKKLDSVESPSTTSDRSLHTDDELQTRQALHHSIGTESIWTADLIQQIDAMTWREKDKLRYLFCSTTFEVDQNYSEFGYYQAAFGSDEERVAKIFQRLQSGPRSHQLLCLDEGLSLNHVLNLVSHDHCIAIVLIDNAVLENSYLNKKGATSYVGHYLILCGVSRNPNHIQMANALDGKYGVRDGFCLVVSNPGQNQPEYSFLTTTRFEQSWRSKGTDEDILFVSVDQ